jgi:hypothetical protein
MTDQFEEMNRRLINTLDYVNDSKVKRSQREDAIYGTFREALELGAKLGNPNEVKVWLKRLGF